MLEEEAATLKELLERTQRDCDRLHTELGEKKEVADAIIKRADDECERLKGEIASLEKDKEELQGEIREWEQTRIELDAIAEQLKEWEQVKAQYEEHIRILTLRLRDARGRRGNFGGKMESSESDIVEAGESLFLEKGKPIDMTASEVGPTGGRDSSSQSSDKGSSSKGRSGRRSPQRRLPKDDSDWLLTLPPE